MAEWVSFSVSRYLRPGDFYPSSTFNDRPRFNNEALRYTKKTNVIGVCVLDMRDIADNCCLLWSVICCSVPAIFPREE